MLFIALKIILKQHTNNVLKCNKGHRKSRILPLNMTNGIFLSSEISGMNFRFNKSILKISLKHIPYPKVDQRKPQWGCIFQTRYVFLLNFS